MPIFGSTWVIGLFAINEHTDVFAWIFTILNSLQVCYVIVCMVMILKCMLLKRIGIPHIFLLCFEARKG